MHKLSEGGDAASSGMGELFDQATCHLTAEHARYFSDMERALSHEEQDNRVRRMEIWGTDGYERERRGTCLAGMRMVSWSQTEAGSWRYSFCRANEGSQEGAKPARPALADLAEAFVGARVLVRRDGDTMLQGFGVCEGHDAGLVKLVMRKRMKCATTGGDVTWRIDRDEYPGSWATIRGNLVHLFAMEGDAKRRALVVDLVAPRFADSSQVANLDDTSRWVNAALYTRGKMKRVGYMACN